MTTLNSKLRNALIYFYLSAYTFVNLLTLTAFPLIHSDEAWLAGLTNEYIKHRTVFVTESFFDLMPRTAHTMKSFYHLLQLPFVTLFGHAPFSVRLPSLIAAVITLYFFHQMLIRHKVHPYRALFYTILISLNLQFVYAGHFGRQEMILLMVLMLCLYLYYSSHSLYKTALLLGLSIGFHPNAFILTAIIGILLFRDFLIRKSISGKQLAGFTAIIGSFALLHMAVTLLTNPGFISDYWAYGQTFGVDAAPSGRIANLRDFYLKLYYQVSGTYYIPPMQLFYIISGLICAGTMVYGLSRKWLHDKPAVQLLMDASLMVVGGNIAIFVVGRYNTTSITFLVLPLYLLILMTLECFFHLSDHFKVRLLPKAPDCLAYGLMVLIALLSFQSLITEYRHTAPHTYEGYLAEIQTGIDDDAIILGNLSSGFLFSDQTFYDVRNLAYLKEDSNVETYIKDRNIDTIIYYEEYDYIHRNPQWQILYGNDEAWYEDLQAFIEENTTLVHEFGDMYYGSRIIRFLGDYPWEVSVYKVN